MMSETKATPIPAPTFRDAFRHLSSRATGWLGVAGGALIVVSAAVVLLGFGILNFNSGGVVHLDSARVALQIQADYKANFGVAADVKCPPNLVAPLNFSFKCMAQSGASVATVNVTIVDVIGNVIWTSDSDLPASDVTK